MGKPWDGRTEASVLFDGSYDGFLCVVYAYYYDKIYPLHIQTEEVYQEVLGAEPYYIKTNYIKSSKVLVGIRRKMSNEYAHRLYYASLSGADDIYMDLLKYVVTGFKMGAKADSFLQNDVVLRVHELARQVGREAHLLTGFCRFAETKQGAYYCEISPKNYVLPILAEHFCDRFKNFPWVIHDKSHGLAAVYDCNEYVIAAVPRDANVVLSDNEGEIQDLWVSFFNTIAIRERVSHKRQRRVLPIYFRKYMLEFIKNAAGC
jgi:probable DNA metabolism protein